LRSGQAPGSPGDVRLGVTYRLTRFELRQDRPACFPGNHFGLGRGFQDCHRDAPSCPGAFGQKSAAVDFQPFAGLADDQGPHFQFDPKGLPVGAQYAISMVGQWKPRPKLKIA
jgi:hypothetical protein